MTENEAIGVIKRLVGISPSERMVRSVNMATSALEEIRQYRAIGTVEECWERAEMRKEKEPKGRYETRYIWDGAYCPMCGSGITSRWKFCQNCGQSIKWDK